MNAHPHALFAAVDEPTTCPGCGGTDIDSNLLDVRLYEEVAREVPHLKFLGKAAEAIEVLSALYARHIINFLRPRWRCVCGVTFDA